MAQAQCSCRAENVSMPSMFFIAVAQVHISVAHEGEVGGDAFRGKGLGQCFVDRHVLHYGGSVWLGGTSGALL